MNEEQRKVIQALLDWDQRMVNRVGEAALQTVLLDSVLVEANHLAKNAGGAQPFARLHESDVARVDDAAGWGLLTDASFESEQFDPLRNAQIKFDDLLVGYYIKAVYEFAVRFFVWTNLPAGVTLDQNTTGRLLLAFDKVERILPLDAELVRTAIDRAAEAAAAILSGDDPFSTIYGIPASPYRTLLPDSLLESIEDTDEAVRDAIDAYLDAKHAERRLVADELGEEEIAILPQEPRVLRPPREERTSIAPGEKDVKRYDPKEFVPGLRTPPPSPPESPREPPPSQMVVARMPGRSPEEDLQRYARIFVALDVCRALVAGNAIQLREIDRFRDILSRDMLPPETAEITRAIVTEIVAALPSTGMSPAELAFDTTTVDWLNGSGPQPVAILDIFDDLHALVVAHIMNERDREIDDILNGPRRGQEEGEEEEIPFPPKPQRQQQQQPRQQRLVSVDLIGRAILYLQSSRHAGDDAEFAALLTSPAQLAMLERVFPGGPAINVTYFETIWPLLSARLLQGRDIAIESTRFHRHALLLFASIRAIILHVLVDALRQASWSLRARDGIEYRLIHLPDRSNAPIAEADEWLVLSEPWRADHLLTLQPTRPILAEEASVAGAGLQFFAESSALRALRTTIGKQAVVALEEGADGRVRLEPVDVDDAVSDLFIRGETDAQLSHLILGAESAHLGATLRHLVLDELDALSASAAVAENDEGSNPTNSNIAFLHAMTRHDRDPLLVEAVAVALDDDDDESSRPLSPELVAWIEDGRAFMRPSSLGREPAVDFAAAASANVNDR